MRESEIEKYLVNKFNAAGAQVRKLQFLCRNGAPDRLIMWRGKVVFVELKATGEKMRPDQQREFMQMKSAGVHVYCIDSKEKVDTLFSYFPYDFNVDDVPS